MDQLENTLDILKEFLALLVILDIDNWFGRFFEIHLNNYYDKVTRKSNYMTFKTTQETKNTMYEYLLVFVALIATVHSAEISFSKNLCDNFDNHYYEQFKTNDGELENHQRTFAGKFFFFTLIISSLCFFLFSIPGIGVRVIRLFERSCKCSKCISKISKS